MTANFNLTGKGAIVTGSSRGIGKSIAEALAAHGANVVISSRKKDGCDLVAEQINLRGKGSAFSIPANVGSDDDLGALVHGAQDCLGQIDILVCNAASNPYYGPMADISDAQFEKVLQNNLLSSHKLAKLVSPAMIKRRSGSIILVSSIGGFRGSGVIGAYNISKAADLALARNLAIDYGPSGVRVNCIAPGLIRTDFARALWEDEANLARALTGTPMGRIGEPEEIAGAAVFLAADASRYMTGQAIVIDGGSLITAAGI
ncbi:glucose 1-dehydrogenase [Altererythrobacter salegens]|uniref:Glucose 1-dehydrogenase n=1 Tax=Croceibacterium salegens TaxID=1737568 RepID=A0A6I4SYX5_9SPHN|nr:SDR family oxidoreductase [Croceibacterium salegens]MXO60638.1 glucose 1-dehydrogenase [Croceibacterium salegens]